MVQPPRRGALPGRPTPVQTHWPEGFHLPRLVVDLEYTVATWQIELVTGDDVSRQYAAKLRPILDLG